ncbi:MAG TPA: glycine cleavage system protein GcvH [Thermodesulfobacteriota bacterium]|nr:glycine cleavage system protein GcvH [Thermodesulfobacteriota bacterium]
MRFPENLRYTRDHEWIRVEGPVGVVGITDHAQDALGDIVFVELPEVGAEVQAGRPFGVVESVKAVSDLYAPASGRVVEVNAELPKQPELVNKDPYGAAWMIKIELADPREVERLMTAAEYEAFVKQEQH